MDRTGILRKQGIGQDGTKLPTMAMGTRQTHLRPTLSEGMAKHFGRFLRRPRLETVEAVISVLLVSIQNWWW